MGYVEEVKSTDDELEALETGPLPQDKVEAETDEDFEEVLVDIDEKEDKPIRKKVAALKARHAIEDYFEMKKLRHELDYLLEEENDITEQDNESSNSDKAS